MSREAELIKGIDEHIKEAGGLYGLELPDSDLQVIRAALVKRVEKKAVHHRCPACGNPAMTETGDSFIDYDLNYCNYCGQALTKGGGRRNGEGGEKREQKTGESSHAGESEGTELKRPQAGAVNA